MNIASARNLAVSLRAQRLERGLTQAQLATYCGVTRKTINEIEAGRILPKWSLLLQILEHLDLEMRIERKVGEEATSPPASVAQRVDLDELLKRQREQ